MKSKLSFILKLLTVQYLTLVCVSLNFDFFYLVEQWPGSYCNPNKSCCYPTGKLPKGDFKIHGLWPNYNNGLYPSNCDPHNPCDQSKISDLIDSMKKHWPSLACPGFPATKFWEHEWNKHGTCSQSVLDQHQYFKTALQLKKKLDHFKFLRKAGIKPNGKSYKRSRIVAVLRRSSKAKLWIQCNADASGKSQLYQIFTCVDASGKKFINCPVMPQGKCGALIKFPS